MDAFNAALIRSDAAPTVNKKPQAPGSALFSNYTPAADFTAMLQQIHDYDPNAIRRAFRTWTLPDLLLAYAHHINTELLRQYDTALLHFTIVAPHAGKKAKPPAAPKLVHL